VVALGADIEVLKAGAFKPVVVAIVPEFERQTGRRLVSESAIGQRTTSTKPGGLSAPSRTVPLQRRNGLPPDPC
jgi:hypothetical protein